ncbi:hypothetical protein C7S16_3463 [Burkholderia thailandensis]|uniref:Uncharacterized protein n=1 Tax=Burkholderia thailandensis TaxID=57975 RepID=A0AAW9D1T7_BURTH|nr:hypothetical protein [Burkholderia thailandensis]MDW9255433.1 hypothetical protein [Burkholderia thailandensis]
MTEQIRRPGPSARRGRPSAPMGLTGVHLAANREISMANDGARKPRAGARVR